MSLKNWESIALESLEKSLYPVAHERNEIDWKSELSDNSEKLAQHLSAFANREEGGFLVFGVSNDGELIGITQNSCSEITKKLGNIARGSLLPPIQIEHSILEHKKIPLLFIYIPSANEKPVCLRSGSIYDSYIRSASQTRIMSRSEVAQAIAQSSGVVFEKEAATKELESAEAIQSLDFQAYFDMSKKPIPANNAAILAALESDGLVKRSANLYIITNLGALLFAKDLRKTNLWRKSVRVIIYSGKDRTRTVKENEFISGYATGFENLVKYVNDQLPTNEVVEQALRRQVRMYPEIAIRELIANMLIHQDLTSVGTGPMVEIFSDRIEITNPGRPLVNTDRFIDSPPQSRNEMLASFMRRLNLCEERGSGIDKVIFEIEVFQLPAPQFSADETHTKAVLYSLRPFSAMEKPDRIRACYQHCCLKYISGPRMSNQTLRVRFKIEEKNSAMVSRIIADTLKAKYIKISDPVNKSKKYTTYIPFWA